MEKLYKHFLLLLILVSGTTNLLKSQCTFTANVPYYQNFTGLSAANPLPNCWARSNTLTCNTYSANTNAGFYASPTNINYFYTNGYNLSTGVVYSVSLFYNTSNNGSNWSDFSMHLGTSQSTLGLIPIVYAPSPVISIGIAQLSGTFTVATPGVYYVAIRGISASNCCNYYLIFDDFSITAPCSVNPVNTAISGNTTTICLGDTLSLNATGANSYTWANGSNNSTFTTVPNGNTNYVVSGSSTLTGCTTSATLSVMVNPRPVMSIFSSTNASCAGSTLNLMAYGNAQYMWSTGSNNAMITVSPSVTTTYSLTGLNMFSCTATATLLVNVYPLPVITAASSKSVSCSGEAIKLWASGAKYYEWNSAIVGGVGDTIPLIPLSNTVFTVTGTDSMGCKNSTLLYLSINPCLGFIEVDEQNLSYVYPNPVKNKLIIRDLPQGALIEIFDLSGKRLYSVTHKIDEEQLNVESLRKGIYTLRITEAGGTRTIKLIKEE